MAFGAKSSDGAFLFIFPGRLGLGEQAGLSWSAPSLLRQQGPSCSQRYNTGGIMMVASGPRSYKLQIPMGP